MKYGNNNYVVSNNPTAYGRYYEFIDEQGYKKVVALHTNDPNRAIHAHAGKVPKDEVNPRTYDFKNQDNRYEPINDLKNKKDHHLDINCKG